MKSQLSFASSTASLVDSQRRFVAHVDPHHRSHPAPWIRTTAPTPPHRADFSCPTSHL